jgi:diguanylate cyclase (GGDEF)-like protein
MNGTHDDAIEPVHARKAARRGDTTPQSSWTDRLIPVTVLLVGMALSVVAGQSVREEMRRDAQLHFDTAAANATVQVERRFAAYFEVLVGLRALFDTVDEVSREDFQRYAQALALKRNFPGYQVLNFAPYVSAESKAAFEKAQPSIPSLPHGSGRFAVTPPGERDGYHPFTLIEPLAENQQYLGKDIAASPPVRAALERARDTGKLSSSAQVFQPKGENAQVGIAVRLPVYRVGKPVNTVEERRLAYLGSVGAGIWVHEMLAGLPGLPEGVRLRLYDGGTVSTAQKQGKASVEGPGKLLFDTAPQQQANTGPSLLHKQSFKLACREWVVEASMPMARDMSPLEKMLPAGILLAGTMMSALMAAVLYSRIGSQRRATTLARDMTRSLRLTHDIARELAADGEFENVVAFILSSIGAQQGWQAAVCWVAGDGDQVRCLDSWATTNDGDLQKFARGLRGSERPRQGGRLDAAWATGNPLWRVIPAANAALALDEAAGRCGLQVAVVVPVSAGTQLVALEFFSRAPIGVDREIEVFMRSTANQMAQYLNRKQAETALRYSANHDALTGLAGRPLLQERLTHAIQRATRQQTKVAVMFMDLDRFKHINDSLGHSAGDVLLRGFAERLQKGVRESDTVARFGGDEFVVVLEGLNHPDDVVTPLTKLRNQFSLPFDVNGRELRATASIGISVFPDDGQDSEALLANADAAMYRAKEMGPGNHHFYSVQMNAQGQERLILENDLPQALEKGELFLVYQPKLDLTTGRITGVEALMRWRHPTLGLISPLVFIPIAEEMGLIGNMGHWALQVACRDARTWQNQGRGVQVSVNLAARQLDRPQLAEEVAEVIATAGLEPRQLELEITESGVMRNPTQAALRLRALRELGVSLAIDDFGTGYSSLSYLRTFPLCTLKIDRSFIKDLPEDEGAANLTAGIIALAHRLRMKVVAEGVETLEQLGYLRTHRCDEIQGYYISKPIPADEMSRFLERDLRNLVSPVVAA